MPETHSLSRPLVAGTRGAVSTCHPLATSVGLEILWRGGNAFDSAVAVAAALGVVEPMSCGAGGDVFALCYDAHRNETTALNAAGAAPFGAHPRQFATGGIPVHGIRSATVPAAVDGWLAVLERYGSLPAADVFAPAIAYAEEGFPAGLHDVAAIDHYAPLLAADPEAAAVFLPEGRPLGLGDRVVQRDLAATLREIAGGGRDAFYRGRFAERLLRQSRAAGGLFAAEDLTLAHASWHEPVATEYRGYTVYAQPPVSHGFILLEALNMLEAYDVRAFGRDDARLAHCMIEIKKLVFADRHAYVGDPRQVAVPLDTLLSKRYAAERRAALNMARAATEVPPGPVPAAAGADTTYFAVADRGGNLVSFMQSLYRGFGSGVIVAGTGVLLNNRMGGFTRDPRSPNALGPGRVPVHNMAPNLVGKDGRAFMAVGTPGGYSQVQSNMQVLTNVLDFGMNVQEAIDAPRWVHGGSTVGGPDAEVTVDPWMPDAVVRGLEERGHRIMVLGQEPPVPRGHTSEYTTSRVEAVMIDRARGTIFAGADPRSEAQAAAW